MVIKWTFAIKTVHWVDVFLRNVLLVVILYRKVHLVGTCYRKSLVSVH